MISTGSFLTETGASNKQSELVKKLTAAWEKKNSKTARAGGASLMALSLAACGGEDTTPFAQSDVDAAVAAAEAPLQEAVAAAEAAQAAAEADAAAALVAQAAAEADAAAALVAQAAAEADAAAALVAQSAAEADAAAALVAQSAAEADAAAATVAAAEATAAKEAAEAAQAAAEASLATAQADLTAKTAEYDALVASNATLQSQYDALIAPKSLAATNSTTPDNLIGGTGNDTFTAAAGTVAATDRFTDTSTTDSDTLTIVHATAPGAFTATNIETIDITLNNLGALTVDAANITGATSLTVTRGDVVVGGSTLAGNKAVRVDNADASQIGSITVGAGTTTVDINSAAADKAGHVLNANNATGAITVDGAATINAASSTDVRIDAVSNTAVAETGKASVINAAAATTVTTHADLTGSIEINAAKATTLTVNDAQGGVTINAASAHTADSTITVVDVDASGATITVGTGVDDSTTAANIGLDVIIDGTAATTDAATISGAGHIELDIDGTNAGNVDLVTLSGNGAGVVFDLAAPNTGTAVSFTKAGTESVEIMGDASEFTGVTVTGIDVIDVISGGGAAFNASLFSGVGKVDLGVDNGNFAITAVSGSTFEITADQTTGTDFDFSAAGGGDLTIIAGDDNGTSTAVGTINLVALDAAAAAATTVGNVTIEASISNVDAEGVTLGAKQNLIITGDEDVNLADRGTAETVTADSVDASGSSGIITINVEDSGGAATVDNITTGSGNDLIQIDATGVMTVSSGAGNDTITIEDADATSTFDAGAGNDTIDVDEVAQIVVIGGEGNDNFTTAVNIGGTIVGGGGTDTITIDADATVTFASTFAFSGISELDITAVSNKVVSMTGAQLAGNSTLILDGNAADDVFNVNTGSTAAAAKSADLSNVTVKTGATVGITVTGNVGADTITGGVASETFTQTIGADSYEGGGGTGVDTFVTVTSLTASGSANASNGTVVNLGSTAISAADVIANASAYISGGLTEVAAGKVAHLYAANLSTNSAELDTIGGIENVTGSAGIDYIVGTSGNNTINGGAGADYIAGGAGADTITGGDGIDTIDLGANDAVTDKVSYFGITAAANANNVTSFEAGAGGDVVQFSDASLAVDAGAFTAGTAVTFATVAAKADTANEIIVDTIANLGALGVTIGNESGNTNNVHQLAIASDTGAIFYDADGDWTAGSVQIGDLDITSGLVVGNVEIIA